MKRSALFKRLGGAALILGIVAAVLALVVFYLRPLAGSFASHLQVASSDALAAVGGHATPDQAGKFMCFAFAALFVVSRRGEK